ncbi:MAG: extracellular solute-binding protein [Kiritimatiellaeota bacterium]|nr:extracellular solute-binding protein [Kiritimatiellota bacterium]
MPYSCFPIRSMRRMGLWGLLLVLASGAQAGGWVQDLPDRTVIHLQVTDLPDPSYPEASNQGDVAVIKEMVRRFPALFAERYRATYTRNPGKYGRHRWDRVELDVRKFSGIKIEGMGGGTLLAIAGGVAPDVLDVYFNSSDQYISQGFLYPLDKPEDNYFTGMTEAEKAFCIHPKVMPGIYRKGPDGQKHLWAMPRGGVKGSIMLYRKDLLDANNVPYPKNDWTWDDYFAICKKVTDPGKGIYGAVFPIGFFEGGNFIPYLWGAGGEMMEYNEAKDEWRAVYNSPAGVQALDFYTRICNEIWHDKNGRKRYGYVMRAPADSKDIWYKWSEGRIAFMGQDIDEKMFTQINPDLTGIVVPPKGPGGQRGTSLGSRLQGIFAGIKDPVIRDAAWEFMRFLDCEDAARIRTRFQVEGGLGRFVNPSYLRMFGYEDMLRFAPKEIEECFKISLATGRPPASGRNFNGISQIMTKPLVKAADLTINGTMPDDPRERTALLQSLLDESALEANERIVGRISPRELLTRRVSAGVVLVLIGITFGFVFRNIAKVFAPPPTATGVPTGWGFRKYMWAYVILVPAVLTILVWSYLPLLIGSKMAFQDYRIMGGSAWVWVDNFGAVLWDADWWTCVWNSMRYCVLVVSLTFLPPVILAVLLQEIPVGKILFRTLFYLPAVITGLVVIYLWKSFYDPTEYGVLNAVVSAIPALGYIVLAVIFFVILFLFAKRLYIHQRYVLALVCLAAGGIVAWFFFSFALPILNQPGIHWYQALLKTAPEPSRWLLDPKTAMFCCVLPSVWAGMGPGCLLYLAALKGIADDFYEAADIDGATFIDKIMFVVIPLLKPLLIIQFVGVFIGSWNSDAFILAMTGGTSGTTVAGLHIFYQAYMFLKFGPATAMAWILGFMLIGFTVQQLRILSRLEFKTTGDKK